MNTHRHSTSRKTGNAIILQPYVKDTVIETQDNPDGKREFSQLWLLISHLMDILCSSSPSVKHVPTQHLNITSQGGVGTRRGGGRGAVLSSG